MSKSIKLFLVFIMFCVVFSFSIVSATDIDINLSSNVLQQNPTDNNTVDNNEIDNNQQTDLNEIQEPDDTDTNYGSDNQDQLSPSGVSSIEEEGLSFSNILNILLITVGVILILLAIAIIIRLK